MNVYTDSDCVLVVGYACVPESDTIYSFLKQSDVGQSLVHTRMFLGGVPAEAKDHQKERFHIITNRRLA